jgi:hypothetical protein
MVFVVVARIARPEVVATITDGGTDSTSGFCGCHKDVESAWTKTVVVVEKHNPTAERAGETGVAREATFAWRGEMFDAE